MAEVCTCEVCTSGECAKGDARAKGVCALVSLPEVDKESPNPPVGEAELEADSNCV